MSLVVALIVTGASLCQVPARVHLQGRITGIQSDLWYRGDAPWCTATLREHLPCHAGHVGCHATPAAWRLYCRLVLCHWLPQVQHPSAELFIITGCLPYSQDQGCVLAPLPWPLLPLAAPSLPIPALLQVAPEAFIPYAGTGESTFLNSIAKDFSVEGYDPERTRKMFLELAIERLNEGPDKVAYKGELISWACQR